MRNDPTTFKLAYLFTSSREAVLYQNVSFTTRYSIAAREAHDANCDGLVGASERAVLEDTLRRDAPEEQGPPTSFLDGRPWSEARPEALVVLGFESATTTSDPMVVQLVHHIQYVAPDRRSEQTFTRLANPDHEGEWTIQAPAGYAIGEVSGLERFTLAPDGARVVGWHSGLQDVAISFLRLPPSGTLTTISGRNLSVEARIEAALPSFGEALASIETAWGDGTSSVGGVVNHTYLAPGDYTITATLEDTAGMRLVLLRNVSIRYAPPVPHVRVALGDDHAISVDARATQEGDGQLTTFTWDWGDGETANGSVASHVYAAPGEYSVRLVVADTYGSRASVTVSVVPVRDSQPPVPAFEVAQSGRLVTVNASATADPNGHVVAYNWDWGDGTSEAGGPLANHSYPQPGAWRITLTAISDKDGTASLAKDITISSTEVRPAPLPPFLLVAAIVGVLALQRRRR